MDEAAFMSQLLGQLDDSLPAPQTPAKKKSSATSAPADYDIAAFLEGAEDWDLDADPFSSPVKPALAPSPPPPPSLPSSSCPSPVSPEYTPTPCTRCVAESVVAEYVDCRWRKAVVARTDPQGETVDVYLYDDWYHTEITPGDRFNVIGRLLSVDGVSRRDISISSMNNYLILHPDMLLTATALSNALQCRRKPILSSLVRSSSDVTPALVWGNFLHEVIQRCLEENVWDEWDVEEFVDDVVQKGLAQLVILGVNEKVAKREILERAKGLGPFKERYLASVPKPEGKLSDTRSNSDTEPPLLAITKLLDIEEDIWSPTYGLKGKIDATVQCTISEIEPSTSTSSYYRQPPPQPAKRSLLAYPLPLELKTGRSMLGMEHRAQTMLYTLLLSERYGADVPAGLLFYTSSENGDIVRVPRGKHEVRGLIVARNELVAWNWKRIRSAKGKGKQRKERMDMAMDIEDSLRAPLPLAPSQAPTAYEEPEDEPEPRFLPMPIDDERACQRCYVIDSCMLFRKTHGSTFSDPDPRIPIFLEDVYNLKTAHLTEPRLEFFRKWERLLSLEERDLTRFKAELWTMGAKEREAKGRCFAGMVLVGSPARTTSFSPGTEPEREAASSSKIHRFTYRFARSPKWSPPPSPSRLSKQSASDASFQHVLTQAQPGSLLNGHLDTGDAVTVSVEPNLLALARGFILDLTPTEVVLGVDHKLDAETIKERLVRRGQADQLDDGEGIVFRIDKDELFGGMARLRNNLAQMFYAGGDTKRLELVVDLRPPLFRSLASSGPSPSLLSGALSSLDGERDDEPLPAYTSSLNSSQISALRHVLSAEDYALILGMPGTGKTTVIAQLIRVLVGRGKSVLLTSYTHSAVDNILFKLDSANGGEDPLLLGNASKAGVTGSYYGILRLGNVDKVHPGARKFTLDESRKAGSVQELERQFMAPPVVATTCLSIDHPMFARRKFDYCIVDEASQITLPTCLGPLRLADKFVLVGDHFQLPPLVKTPEARQGGLDVSLFRLLSQAHPRSVVDLRYQYRMNEDIMTLSNHLIYDGRLRCGSEEVKNQALVLPDRSFVEKKLHGPRGPLPGSLCFKEGCWIERLLREECKAVFVDTDLLPARDSRVGDLVQNTVEASLIRQLTHSLISSGVPATSIGLISLYRQQVKLLSHLLHPTHPGLEILTADKSQGRDKEVVIISLVKSNVEGNVGELVKDWRRVNVAFTRAKRKLVIVGSRGTLRKEKLLERFFELVEEKGWVEELKKGAEGCHEGVFGGVGLGKREAEEEIEVEEIEPEPERVPVKIEEREVVKVKDEDDEEIEFIDFTMGMPDTKKEPSKEPSLPLMNVDIDDDEIEIVEVVPAPVKPTPRPVVNTKAKAKATGKVRPKIEDDDDEIIFVDTPVASSSSSKSKASSKKGKENTADNAKMHPFFARFVAKDGDGSDVKSRSVSSSSSASAESSGSSTRPAKKARVVNAPEVKKGKGLNLKGRPILHDLVKNET